MTFCLLLKSVLGVALVACMLTSFTTKVTKPIRKAVCYLMEESNWEGKKIYTLDKSNRLIRITNFDAAGQEGARSEYTYGPSGKLIKDAYYAATPDEGGSVVMAVEYGYTGNLISTQKHLETIGDGAPMETMYGKFARDNNKHISQLTVYPNPYTQEPSSMYQYEYDTHGNLTKITAYNYEGAEKALDWTYEFTYDDKRNPKAAFRTPELPDEGTTVNNVLSAVKKDSQGNVVYSTTYTYEYNSDNLPVSRSTVTDAGQTSDVTTYTYTCK